MEQNLTLNLNLESLISIKYIYLLISALVILIITGQTNCSNENHHLY